MQYKKILKKDIKDLSSLYLVYGQDEYLINQFIDRFMDVFVAEEFRDFNLAILEEGDNLPSQLVNAVETLPFMFDRRFVVVNTNKLFTKKIKNIEIIYNLLDDLPETTVLIFVSYNKPDKRMKIFKKIKKIGEILKFESLKYRKLDQWIRSQFDFFDQSINKDAIKLLKEAFNNDLKRLKSEIDKIITFVGEKKRVTKADVEAIISRDWLVEDNIIFDFVDAIGRKNLSSALQMLADMRQEGTQPKVILGMIARQFRLMLQAKLLAREGLNANKIAKRLKQHPYPIKKCLKQSRNFAVDDLELALERLHKADCRLVTGADQELELELLVVDLKETI